MKPVLTPVYFETGYHESFHLQLERIRTELGSVAEIAAPVLIGEPLPEETDLVLIPVLVGEAYKKLEEFKNMQRPVLLLTSEFMTIAMWDWEIRTFLEMNGVQTFAPYTKEQAITICKAYDCRTAVRDSVFLMYQETPGDGMQPEIFKRFFWWEQACIDRMEELWGVRVQRKSLKELGERACQIPDTLAQQVLAQHATTWEDVCDNAKINAAKLYLAICDDLEKMPQVKGVGTNCLNESFYCSTTPCFAWNLLYKTKGLLWACEADIVSLLTKFLLHTATGAPVMMTNMYPFLMGSAAIKHEKIEAFPTVPCPEDCVLGVHCGYVGFMPEGFAKTWSLRERVLEIVDDNAVAVDACYEPGPVTIVQLHQDLRTALVVQGILESYAEYPGSDCRRGAVIRVKNGQALMRNLYSHHAIVMPGYRGEQVNLAARILGLKTNEI